MYQFYQREGEDMKMMSMRDVTADFLTEDVRRTAEGLGMVIRDVSERGLIAAHVETYRD
jgi:hypothetical protein